MFSKESFGLRKLLESTNEIPVSNFQPLSEVQLRSFTLQVGSLRGENKKKRKHKDVDKKEKKKKKKEKKERKKEKKAKKDNATTLQLPTTVQPPTNIQQQQSTTMQL